MLRVVIQVSMVVAIPLMAVCLYIWPQYAPWYVSYVILFNMLVGPVFSAGTVTSERERQTLDLLLTTPITPWQILWGKLIAGLRVSSVLTTFLLWPLLLACLMVSSYWTNIPAVGGYLGIVLVTCLTTAVVALFCSVLFHKTSVSLMTAYLVIIVLFCAPLAARFFAEGFFPRPPGDAVRSAGRVDEPVCRHLCDSAGCGDRSRGDAASRVQGDLAAAGQLRRLYHRLESGPAVDHDLAVQRALASIAVTCGRRDECIGALQVTRLRDAERGLNDE